MRQQPYTLAAEWRRIEVTNERQLRAALNNPSLGWADRRVVQLTADILLAATITISSPVRIEGNCAAGPGGRCTLRAARLQPLLHITGPTALVQLGNLELVGGRGVQGMAGAVTASNQSEVDLTACLLSTNSAPAGGAVLITANAHLNLVDSEVSGNTGGECGGGVMLQAGSLHLDRSIVEGNAAASGGGICANPGTTITAVESRVAGNQASAAKAQLQAEEQGGSTSQRAQAAEAARGADFMLLRSGPTGIVAAAYFEPLPEPGAVRVTGAQLLPMAQLPTRLRGRDGGARAPPAGADDALAAASFNREAAAAAYEVGERARKAALPRRALRQSAVPAGADVVSVNGEMDLAQAIRNKARYVTLDSHIILTGGVAGPKSLLPSIKSSITITGTCADPYNGKCLLNAQGLGAILFADNTAFLPGMEVTFENILFLNGQASAGQGGALSNTGALSATFTNCDFLSNAAGTGGAVALVEGAFSIFTDCNFKGNAAATDGSGTGTGGAVLLTGSSGFTRCNFEGNTGQNGGAVGVGGSSQGIFFNTCNFTVGAWAAAALLACMSTLFASQVYRMSICFTTRALLFVLSVSHTPCGAPPMPFPPHRATAPTSLATTSTWRAGWRLPPTSPPSPPPPASTATQQTSRRSTPCRR